MTKQPTNADLYGLLATTNERVTALDVKFESKLDAIHQQTTKTNGRVTRLETLQSNTEAVDAYKRAHPSQSRTDSDTDLDGRQKEEGWTTREKQLIAIITALLGLIAAFIGAGTV